MCTLTHHVWYTAEFGCKLVTFMNIPDKFPGNGSLGCYNTILCFLSLETIGKSQLLWTSPNLKWGVGVWETCIMYHRHCTVTLLLQQCYPNKHFSRVHPFPTPWGRTYITHTLNLASLTYVRISVRPGAKKFKRCFPSLWRMVVGDLHVGSKVSKLYPLGEDGRSLHPIFNSM